MSASGLLWIEWYGGLVPAKWIVLTDGTQRLVPWWF